MGMEVLFLKISVRVVGVNGEKKSTYVTKTRENTQGKNVNLTSDYVHKLSQGISLRIRQRDSLHANSEQLASKAQFR